MLGKILGGRYQITHHLGGGGFGQTYLAEDLHLPGKPACVVKQLKPRIADLKALQAARRLFDVEAQALYALGSHDQIPQLFAHFEEGEGQEFFLVQEFVEGVVLSQELHAKKRLGEADVLSLLRDLLTVLEFVHEQNVVHRDIKPSNLIRRKRDRRLVLIDFGAVKQIGVPLEQLEDHHATVTIAIGSSGYMPNEQLAGKPRFSSDIYAVGMLAIQCLTGVYPKRLKEDPISSEIVWRDQVQVSPDLADFIDTMVRYDFRQRFASAKEALVALLALTQASVTPPPPPPRGKLVTNDSYVAWLERGDELFQQQRHREAIAAYDKVIQVKPDEYAAFFKRGICLENLSRFDEAAASYAQVVQLQPQDYLAWYRQGNVLERLQQFNEAIAAYEQVIQIQPDNYWAWHDKGKVLENLHQLDDALTAYDRAVQLKPDFSLAIDSRKRVLSQLRRVDDLFHLQHYDEALASCDRAIQQNPDDSLAWLMRGMALDNLQRYEDAITAYDQVVAIQPDDHVAWFKRGNTLEKLQRYEDAIASYYRVVQIQPDNHWAWNDRGRLLEQMTRFEEAMAAYDRAHQIRPDFQPAIEGRKRVLHQLKHQLPTQTPADAKADGTQVMQQTQATQPIELAEAPTTTVGFLPLPDSNEAGGFDGETSIHSTPEPSSSVESVTPAPTATARPEPTKDYNYWLRYGRSLERLQRHLEALAAFDRAAQIRDDDAELWRSRGSALFNLGRYRRAHAAYVRATELNPTDDDLWFWAGVCLTRLKRYPEGISAFEQATHHNPAHHQAWYWQGRVLCELKQYGEAIHCFNQTLKLEPKFQPAVRSRQYLLLHIKTEKNRHLTTAQS